MRKVLRIILLIVIAAAAPAAAQEPRLPPPAYPGATVESLDAQKPASIDALILRARLLSKAGRFRESADSWREVGAREPLLSSFSLNEALRADLDASDLHAALGAIAQSTAAIPTDILLRAAAASRSAGMVDRATALYKRARTSAGRSSSGDQAALGLAATLEQAGNLREALDAYRELQLTFRQPSA